jgi:hypothetical protein
MTASRKMETAARKAAKTCRWAKIMTAWIIRRNWATGAKWHIVDFVGPNGSESRGIVDLLAVRKNHAVHRGTIKRGDLLDIVLIQVKGGNAPFPTQDDVSRLRNVARYHRAKAIVLSEWKRKECLRLYLLKRDRWLPVKPRMVFG